MECDYGRQNRFAEPMATVYGSGHVNFNAASEPLFEGFARMRVLWESQYRVIKLIPTNEDGVGKRIVRSRKSSSYVACSSLGKFMGLTEKFVRAKMLRQEDGSILIELPPL